ncbi:MAG: maleylpyruvate isomerase family mycothiol-dependent enzyme, partial [Deltaproteobacteria bacterium]|nr:maleylpyruvate isomerase family mycothiol-dependent enzyme [Deltaproteobacteria bacterium]
LAIEDRERNRARARGVMEIVVSGNSLRHHTNTLLGIKDPKELLDFWRDVRSHLLLKLNKMSSKDRIQWYGPDMSALSFATGRLMETWAHSQDVFDTLKKKRTNGKGLYHIAYMGVSTFTWSFIIKEMTPPRIFPRVELVGPSGEVWEWGEPNSSEKVWGSAEEFCLMVTQRRNIRDTSLKCQGRNTEKWLSMAQAFAGASQEPPAPGSRIIDYGKPIK